MNVADDDTAASNLQQNLLKEAYSAAASNLAALQHTLDSMGTRIRPSEHNRFSVTTPRRRGACC